MAELMLVKSILIALALGALIGLEREYYRYQKRGYSYAGIRTYPLIALFGVLSAYLGDIISSWILIVGIILIGLLILVSYFAVTQHKQKYIGATSEVAGFITFFIGVLSYYNEIKLAAVIAITMAVILYARSLLHNFAKKMKRQEMADTLKFAVIAFVILPFLPNKGYGPMELFNPYTIWLMVVLISGISFIGYIFIKWFGEKGITIAGLLGGVASSTVVTTSFAHRSLRERKHYRALALGVILANGVMFLRILLLVFLLNRPLFFNILLPMAVLTILTGLLAYLVWRKAKKIKGKVQLTSPFTIIPALKFALIFAITSVLVKLGYSYFAAQGVYAVSFLSGLTDVDAITISLSRLTDATIVSPIAKSGILIAAVANIVAKGGIAYWQGGKEFAKIVVSVFSVLILAGVIFLFTV